MFANRDTACLTANNAMQASLKLSCHCKVYLYVNVNNNLAPCCNKLHMYMTHQAYRATPFPCCSYIFCEILWNSMHMLQLFGKCLQVPWDRLHPQTQQVLHAVAGTATQSRARLQLYMTSWTEETLLMSSAND